MSGKGTGEVRKSLCIGLSLGLALFFALRLCTNAQQRFCIGAGGCFGIFCAGASYPLLSRISRRYRELEQSFSEPILHTVQCRERIVSPSQKQEYIRHSRRLPGGRLYLFARGIVFFSAEQQPPTRLEYHYNRLEACSAHGRCLSLRQSGGESSLFVLNDQKTETACSALILAWLSGDFTGE